MDVVKKTQPCYEVGSVKQVFLRFGPLHDIFVALEVNQPAGQWTLRSAVYKKICIAFGTIGETDLPISTF
jgi:hypothetical protein